VKTEENQKDSSSKPTSFMTLMACAAAALLIGSFWGTVDIVHALMRTDGAEDYAASIILILLLYIASSLCLAMAMSLLGIGMRISPHKTLCFTTAFLFSLYGIGLMLFFGKYYLSTPLIDIRNLFGFLALFALCLFLSMRFLNRPSNSLRKIALSCIALSSSIGLALAAYTVWESQDHQLRVSIPPAVARDKALPNFLVVIMDSVRPDHLSLYGYKRPTSPNLEVLRREGAVYLNAYAQSSWTKPSVAALMSSLYPSAHSTNDKKFDKLPSEILTLPEILKENNYVTAAFASNNAFVSAEFGFDQGFDYFYETRYQSFLDQVMAFNFLRRIQLLSSMLHMDGLTEFFFTIFDLGEKLSPRPCQSDSLMNRQVFRWLSANKDQPFFIYIHYMCSHYPYEPDSPDTAVWQREVIDNDVRISEESRRKLLASYDNAIRYTDTLIGDIMGNLRRLGVYDQTFLVVAADHGEEFYERDYWSHGKTLYDEVIRVPLIFRYPPLVRPNQIVSEPVMLVDIAPTLLKAASISPGPAMEGSDLLTKRPDKRNHGRAYSELIRGTKVTRAIIKREEYYIKTTHEGREWSELYNLRDDVLEKHNLWRSADNETKQTWERELKAFSVRQHNFKREKAIISEDTKQRLRSLGYIQ